MVQVYERSVVGNKTAEFESYNNALLSGEAAWQVKKTVAHRANRAVLFPSALYHKSDEHRFREGYTNRRVNLVLLFGLPMASRCAPYVDEQRRHLAQRGEPV